MKVGIVSIFDNNNYGNRLQNYALQRAMANYADQTVTFKNKPFFSGKSRLARMLPLAESVTLNRILGMERRAQMVRFTRRYIPTSRGCYWYDQEHTRLKGADCCDLYCAGSDQVWSPACGRWGMFSYLGFAQPERTFSYAASFGIDRIPPEHQEAVRRGLQHIRHISVREDAGRRIVEELTGRTDVQVLVDPTMLLSAEEWDEIAVPPRAAVPQRYVLTYFLGEVSERRREAVREKARTMGCEIIELMDPDSPFHNIAPDEFVYLIRGAALVCTDSFHASVFSFLYQRPLAIFDRKGSGSNMGSRLETLAVKFSLTHCLAVGDEMPVVPEQADYAAGHAALEAERQKADAFLRQVFQEAERAGLCD